MRSPPPSPHRAGPLPAPARLARALLRWRQGADADALEGDLAEAWQARRTRDGGVRAWLWAWGQVLAAVLHGHAGGTRRRGGVRPGLAIRLAARSLVRDPSTSVLAVLILALGMAAPATFASLMWGAVRPLPVPDGDRIVRLDVVQPAHDGRSVPILGADLDTWRTTGSLSAVGGFQVRSATLQDDETAATRVSLAALSADVLPLLSVSPQLGRLPDARDASSSVILGHELWTDHFGADPDVPGRVLSVDGTPRTVAAVMPEGFAFPFNQDAWVVLDAAEVRETPLEAVGRLSDGASVERAAEELQARWTPADDGREPELGGGMVLVRPYTAGRGEGGEAVAFFGLVLVGLSLLVIACANVANLLLVRAARRVRALGIQAALGAGRFQLGLQVLLESLILAVLGGAGGLFLAGLVVGSVQEAARANFGYYWMRMAVDGPVLPGIAGLVALTALVAGALPALRVIRTDVRTVLGSDAAAVGADGGRWARVFVSTQLALSCAALVAAGLTGRTLMQAADWGGELDADRVLVARLHLSERVAGEAGREALLASLAQVPGVRGAALGLGAPGAFEPWGRLELEGVVYERPTDRPVVFGNAVSPSYFGAMGIDLVRGRPIADTDLGGATPVVVVSENFARRFLADLGGDVLGHRLRVPMVDTAWATVVGVVEDVELGGGPEARSDRFYLSLAQVDAPSTMALLRSEGPAGTLAPGLRRAVAAVDPSVAVNAVQSLADLHRYMVRAPATLAALAVAGGLAGLLVATVGLYGVLAVRVRQRERELGVRLALGANGGRLAREVLGWALGPLLPAVAVGLAIAWLAGPVLAIALLGGRPRDPVVFAAVAASFLTIGCIAALVPARRAAATDPARALRAD